MPTTDKILHRLPRRPLLRCLALAAALCAAGAAQAQETFKVGIVSFLSGQAAESFGIPAVNGAKLELCGDRAVRLVPQQVGRRR